MPQPTPLSTLLRVIPNELLKKWFHDHIPGPFDIPWETLGENDIEPMIVHLDELPSSIRKDAEIDLRTIRSFASEAGMRAIEDTARMHGEPELMSRIPDGLNLNGRAMWVRLHEWEILHAATTLLHLEEATFWRKRNGVPSNVEIAGDADEQLGNAVSNMLREEGRGQHVTVERLENNGIVYFIVHPDDFVRSDNTHDDQGRLATVSIRPTLDIIFAYDRHAGSFELCASLPKTHKERLEPIFSRAVLGWQLPPYEDESGYYIDHLKDPTTQLPTDPADQIRVRIEEIKMFNPSTRRRISTDINKHDETDTIHRAISEELRSLHDVLANFSVNSVGIRFVFPATRYARAGGRIIRITPGSCNLRSLTPDRAEIVQKHLRMWGVDDAPTDEPNLVSVGA
ncbi:hypothetical protein [Planctomycetes bacterium TBK1r]|uniref:Uncharacterized protein n=1 Tax=Stieleria magnilauensis TaxID=2527963 RepID=A0ABX5XX56_9BACT|nr:hypothetical protein TBK1r_45390 [Planctomycetes bacterium TBK1r]